MTERVTMVGTKGGAALTPDEWPENGGYHQGPHPYNGDWCEAPPVCVPYEEPEVPELPRESALSEAKSLITGDRNNQYGPPTQDFARTADLLNALGYGRTDAEGVIHPIKASDVAIIIAQVKVSRIMHTRGKRDSWVDLAGYAACGYECAVEEEKEDA